MPYEAWVESIFGGGSMRDEVWDQPPATTLAYVTRAFRECGALLERFSEERINAGLHRIIDEADPLMPILDANLPQDARLDCIAAIESVYRDIFVKRCSQSLGHLDEPGARPLNDVCYMWWDIFPTWGDPACESSTAIDRGILTLLERVLLIEHDACRESALHGLGHWHLHYPGGVTRTIDRYLRNTSGLRAELVAYAEQARIGMVQ